MHRPFHELPERKSEGAPVICVDSWWPLLGFGGGCLYRVVSWLYGATERIPVEAVPFCSGRIALWRLVDAGGTILWHRCSRCGSARIIACDVRGRRWVSTYTHFALGSRVSPSFKGICRGIHLARNARTQLRSPGCRDSVSGKFGRT